MPASVTTTSQSTAKKLSAVTVTLAGHSTATAYSVTLTTPSGQTQKLPVTTDGSGAGTVTFVPQEAGSYTVATYSAAPVTASATITVQIGSS